MSLLLPFMMLMPVIASPDGCSQLVCNRPLVVKLSFIVSRDTGDTRTYRPGDTVKLARGEAVTVRVVGRDQWGGEFPEDRAFYWLESSNRGGSESSHCGILYVKRRGNVVFEVRARDSVGECTLRFGTACNLNVQVPLKFKVVELAERGYTRAQAEYIVRRLYLALLNREPDPTGFRAAVAEVQRGRLRSQVRGMVRSREFNKKRRGMTPPALLEQIYRGLLGRVPDSEGVRHFLPMVERGKVVDVVLPNFDS